MRAALLYFCLSLTAPASLYAQVGITPDTTLGPTALDFWVGEWNLTYQGPDGTTYHGTNRIARVMNQSVVEENFALTDGPNAGFLGKSLSVYNPKTRLWRQAWVDNGGGYFSFTAGKSADGPTFFEHTTTPGGKPLVRRMTFKQITPSSFLWDWESSVDGGLTWTLLWRLNYTRAS